MNKGHPLLSVIVAILLGVSLVFGGYVLMHRDLRYARKPAIAAPITVKPDTLPQKVERKIHKAPATGQNKPSKEQVPDKHYDLNSVPPMPENLPDKEDLRVQFNMLRSFLELPPERLSKIRVSIEKIEAMPQEQKQRLLGLIQDTNKNMPDSTIVTTSCVNRAKALIPAMSAEDRAFIESHTKGYSKELRAAYIEGYVAAAKDRGNAGANDKTDSIPSATK